MVLVTGKVLPLMQLYFRKFFNLKFIKIAHTEQSLSKLSMDDLARLVLDHQGDIDSMLKTVKVDICKLKFKSTALESELHVNKTVTDNVTKYVKTLEAIL